MVIIVTLCRGGQKNQYQTSSGYSLDDLRFLVLEVMRSPDEQQKAAGKLLDQRIDLCTLKD